MSKQVLRSGTAIGANLAEALYSISKPEFVSKIGIAQKEAHETLYWLELLGDNGFISAEEYDSILRDCDELLSMLTATVKTSRDGISKE